MIRRCVGVFLFPILCTAVVAADPVPDAWPQFRGPSGSGVAPDKKPAPSDLSKSELWKTAVPMGLSSPCVWGERVFVTSCDAESKSLETICLNRRDGTVQWRDAVTAEKLEEVHKTSSQATATPACDGQRVYVDFGCYGLIAYALDGKKAWELKLPMPTVMFGTGASPALIGDLVVLNRLQSSRSPLFGLKAGGAASEIIAVDTQTGAVAWRSPINAGLGSRSYATPLASSGANGDCVIIAAGTRVSALDAKTGKATWWMDDLPLVSTASPVVAGDRLFVNNTGLPGDVDRVDPPTFDKALELWDKNKDGKLQRSEIPDDFAVLTRHRADHEGDFSLKQWFFNRADANKDGALDREEWDKVFKELADNWITMMKPALVSLKLGGTGKIAVDYIAWQTHRGVPEVPTLLVHDNRVYAVRNGGVIICYDADSGKVLYEERLGASGSYYASPVTDGTHIYCVSQPGVVTVIRASDKFQRVSRHDLHEDVGATPAIVGGQVFVRTVNHVYAFGPSR
jgi:outer membrane protein assembly factor BamB